MEGICKVSVIVPFYNSEKYIAKCIDSILCQSFDNLEIVLADDGSTDSSPKIADSYAVKDHRVRAEHFEHDGLPVTRRRGLNRATGSYILFIDSDDWIEKRMIEKVVNTALKTGADFVSCNYFRNYPDHAIMKQRGKKEICVYSGRRIVKAYFERRIPQFAWGKLFSSDMLKEEFFIKEHIMGEDQFLNFHIIRFCKRAVFINEPLYHYRFNSSSMTSAGFSESNIVAYQKFKEAQSRFLSEYPEFFGIICAYFAEEFCGLVDPMCFNGIYDPGFFAEIRNYGKKYWLQILKNANSAVLRIALIAMAIGPLAYFLAYLIRENALRPENVRKLFSVDWKQQKKQLQEEKDIDYGREAQKVY